MARLIIRYPDNRIQEVEFKKPTYKIGAAEDNDLVLENDEVAPNQAEIETSGGNYFLVDVSGNETTTVNGKIIDRVNITYGDRINFGPVVGLFYPPQKKNVFGEKTKLVMYLGAGAVVLIVSFVLIYYFTTRQISTVVTERIGGDIPALQSVEKEPEPSPQPSIEPPAAEAEEAEDKAASAEAEQTGRASQKEGIFSKIKNIFSQKPQLELPQPDQSTIKNRTAIAVPQGIEKLFFRKIPVEVERPEKEPEEAQVEEKAEPEKPSEETTKPAAPEQPAPEEPQPTPQPSAQQPAQEEAPAMPEEEGVSEEGFFSRIIKPIKNLFFPGEELEEAAGAGEAPSAPATAPEEFPEPEAPAGERQQPEETLQQAPAGKPSPEHIKKVLDPLAYISSIDVPGLKGKELEEGPIYSEEELTEYKKTTVEEVQLSESENMNMDTVWRFPPGMGEAVPIIRTGVGLNVDGQKDLEMVYGSTAGRLAALKGSSGEQVLVQDTGKPFFGPVFLDADDDGRQDIVLLFENGDGVAYTQNLEQLWYYQGQSSIVASPLVSDLNQDGIPDMVFPIRNMDIQAIDGTTGFELWRFFDAQSETIFPPVGVDLNQDKTKDVVFCTVGGQLYALDGKTGWGLWKNNIFGRPAGPPAVGDLDGDGKDEIVNMTRKGILSSYDLKGKLLFTIQLEGSFGTAPSLGDVDGDGNIEIVVIDRNGVLKAIEGKTRREEWSLETGEGSTAGRICLVDINFDGGMDAVFTTMSGVVLAIDGKTGSQLARFNCRDYVMTTPVIGDINNDKSYEILVATYGGRVYALQVAGARKRFLWLKKSHWVTENHDQYNSGCSHFYFLRPPWK